ncbi:phosphotransferase enzyme family protein [Ceratobasidium sp. AG-Ba]|nr:phosphotransferase enzyme family protein [Ceratobasidium sp. AG-Ba]
MTNPLPAGIPTALPRWQTQIFGLVHTILIKFSRVYNRNWGKSNIQGFPGLFVLPFGLLIKSHERTTEEEAQSMRLARKLGIPVPRCISYGYYNGRGSILMTRINGYTVGEVYPQATEEQKAQFKLELTSLLATLRSWSPPAQLGNSICSVFGGPVWSYRIPPEISGPWDSEAAFIETMSIGMNTTQSGGKDTASPVREIPSRPHRVVFTHGDLFDHNILVDENCHILAVIDWATAAWMPEWWEYAVALRMPSSRWARLMTEIGGAQYEWELTRDRFIIDHWVDAFRY